jgi:hypothetical protein
MAMDFLAELDPDCLLATSGSVEGVLSGLADRPKKTSMYFRDEVAGFFSEIQKKDYLSGMAEALAHLYDCPAIDHRRLRKETITIVSPVFIFFGRVHAARLSRSPKPIYAWRIRKHYTDHFAFPAILTERGKRPIP